MNENENFTFFLDGDLCQMGTQREFLSSRGIKTQQCNVYPCLKKSDVKRALSLIWEFRVPGWWHYKSFYIQHEICTEEQYINRLKNY